MDTLTAETNRLFARLILTLELALKQTTFKELSQGLALSSSVGNELVLTAANATYSAWCKNEMVANPPPPDFTKVN